MRRIAWLLLALTAAACSVDPSPVTPESATTPSVTVRQTTTSTAASTTTSISPASSTAVTTTTATTATTPPASTTTGAPGAAAIRIDEVVFAGDPYLVLANRGGGPGSTAGYWICRFPNYYGLPDIQLEPGERLAVPLGTGDVPDLVGVVATVDVELPLGTVSRMDGELGLYAWNEFNSPEAILDYVEWGSAGHARSAVAVAAGIWVDGGFVEVPAEVLALVAQSFPTTSPDDWFAEIGG